MQFHHAHAFRMQVGMALGARVAGALAAWLALGAEPIEFDVPGGAVHAGHRSRRDTFERALRDGGGGPHGSDSGRGHVDGVCRPTAGSAASSWTVADRGGPRGRRLRAVRRGTDEARERAASAAPAGWRTWTAEYRLRDGAEPGPLTNPHRLAGRLRRLPVAGVPHERGLFSVLLIRPTADAALRTCGTWTRSTPPAGPSGAGRVDRSGPRDAGDRRARRGLAAQRVPRPVARGRRPARPGWSASATRWPRRRRSSAGASRRRSSRCSALLALLDAEADPACVGEPFDAWCARHHAAVGRRPRRHGHRRRPPVGGRRRRPRRRRLPSDLIQPGRE